jgi:outer membrane protein assembly factor BamB
VKWSSPAAPMGNLTAADGKLIWITGNGELVVVEATPAAYKEIVRAQVSGGKVWSAPVLANGKLYIRNSKGDVVCVDVKGTGPVS